jgi:hypothetical protein
MLFHCRDKLVKIVENFDAVQNKRQWVAQWKHSSFGEQLAASACLHGLMFSSLELVRDWLKNRTKNALDHDLIDTFDKMILDQQLQRDFDCLMISHLKNKPNMERMLSMVNESAKLEFDFIINGLKIELIQYEADDIIALIDRKTKDLKQKMFQTDRVRKQITNEVRKVASHSENMENTTPVAFKETQQKFVIDEDF